MSGALAEISRADSSQHKECLVRDAVRVLIPYPLEDVQQGFALLALGCAGARLGSGAAPTAVPSWLVLTGVPRRFCWLPRGDPKASVWLRLTALPDLQSQEAGHKKLGHMPMHMPITNAPLLTSLGVCSSLDTRVTCAFTGCPSATQRSKDGHGLRPA